jgi:hypothetical protein
MAREKKSSPSWGVVIFLLIVFWPVGLYFLFNKLSSDRVTTIGSGGKVLKVVGWVFIIMAVVYIVLGSSGEGITKSGETKGSETESSDVNSSEKISTELIALGAFFGVGGVLMLVSAKRKQIKSDRYRKYIAIVTNNRERQIDNIASAIPTTYDKAHNELQEMISKGFFEDAYIDESKREIIFTNRDINKTMEEQFSGNQPKADQMQFSQDLLNQMQFGEDLLNQIQLDEQQLKQQINGQKSNQQQYSKIHVTQTIITNQQPVTKEEKTPEKKGPRVVVCKNCGGNNKILDAEISECEYCGSPIE